MSPFEWFEAAALTLRLRRAMSAKPEFRCSIQAASEPNLSWWHISVSIKRPGFFRKDKIERCSVSVEIQGTKTDTHDIRDLRWRSRDQDKGLSETTLEIGQPKFIPIAIRDERESIAVLTDEQYLLKDIQNVLQLPHDDYGMTISLKSGKLRWDSPSYILRVPDKSTSNGHFTLDLHYEDTL